MYNQEDYDDDNQDIRSYNLSLKICKYTGIAIVALVVAVKIYYSITTIF